MQVHELVQGSAAWLAHRAQHFNASDAPAMMGCSPYKTRSDLMRELATGFGEAITPEKQRIFNEGHRSEALARPLAEEIIGEDLYPVVGSKGRLSASFDGLTLDERIGSEHKSLNDRLRQAFDSMGGDVNAGHLLPLDYRVQMEQQCEVGGCEKILFMATKWDGDKLVEARHCWYFPDLALRAEINAGWAQLEKDVCAYTPEPVAAKIIGKTRENLPALHIELTGKVTSSNLAAYKAHAVEVFGSINTTLTTDQDFADAAETVKWCEGIEARIKAAKENALGQTADIDELFRTLDFVAAEARRVRLDLDNKVEKEKLARRQEIVADAQQKLDAHIKELNDSLGEAWIPRRVGPFAEAIKGKRSLETCRDAANTALASEKVASTQLAHRLQKNHEALTIDGKDWSFLFADFATVGTKDPEDFKAVSLLRIQQHKDQEAMRLERDRLTKLRAAIAACRFTFPEPEAAPAPAALTPEQAWPMSSDPTPIRRVSAARSAAPAREVTWIKTSDVAEALGLPVNADLLATVGYPGTKRAGPGMWWDEARLEDIQAALAVHSTKALAKYRARETAAA